MAVLQPAIVWFLLVLPQNGHPSFSAWAPTHITWDRFLNGTGPLWFCAALLIFCTAYTVIRMVVRRPVSAAPWIPRNRHVWAMIAVMSVATFLVRIAQPQGTAIYNMQLCYFADYVLLFMAGIHAARHGWLTTLPRILAARWMRIGV